LAADILSSSAKLADAFITVKEVAIPDSEPEEESTQETTNAASTARQGEDAAGNDDDADTESKAI
jgi:hypothetical protein